ncbi:MAG: type III restriction endonuclease subunit R [Rhodoferax ferrireducens]|uniref:Type III restriction endonuclease subunit R n=1 Tax=Rhodoferax ferrireducens TaxID=192843 RepID=A0A1W9KTZ9_9BURK|nr:MAG: type III restriction endonuclease subunit R [Rhodoferax ferrireducens]
MPPGQKARVSIDALLTAAGWHVCNMAHANIHAARGVAIREFPLNPGYGFADYLLYIDAKAAGVIEAKKEGSTLTGVEVQSARYAQGLPSSLPAWVRPLPFSYESTGIETHFTQGLDPEPRARAVFAFHRPETLAAFLKALPTPGWAASAALHTGPGEPATAHDFDPAPAASSVAADPYGTRAATFLGRIPSMPTLIEEGLWPAQIIAIRNLEASLKANKPRALIQMATGSGKTYTAISFIYRLIKFAGAKRVLFLVDRGNLGRQTKKEFDQYTSPYNNFKFGEEYIVQHLQSNQLDTTARVTICTIQRLFSMLKGRELAPEDDEQSVDGLGSLFKTPEPIGYNPAFPIETFDIIVTDEAHRSIYNLWRQVLEYFDAYLIGLTATPSKQTFGFFNQNLVMEYGHPQAVADGVNVNYDVYRIRTQVSEHGSQIEAGYSVGYRDRLTRQTRWQELDEDMAYDADALDRAVQTPDQIRTIVRTFRDKLPLDIFPGRTEVPKTLVFAKDDNHAEKIVDILREEFGKGNDFAQKITYKTTGDKPENLISAFRNSYFPRIAVTVDMIATGTDIKPVEIVMFMRSVKSRNFFEQMKGRGVRICDPTDLQAVTPDAVSKTHFVIVDCVGVCEQDKTDSAPMDAKKSVPFDKLLQAVALGNVQPEVLSSVAARLARMDRELTEPDKLRIVQASGGASLKDLARSLVDALNPDTYTNLSPGEADQVMLKAVKPLCDPALRNLLIDLKKKAEQVIDTVTQDTLLEADFSEAARDRAKGTVESFEAFITQHKDEITALQILYQQPQRLKGLQTEILTFEALKALADTLQAPPHLWTEGQLWQAYAALDKSRVKGENRKRILTDLVSLVRFAMHQDNELVPFPERVNANYHAWLAQQTQAGTTFTSEQRHWLDMIRDHIAANLSVLPDDFEYSPFAQEGGMGRVYQLFGAELPNVLEALNRELAA